MKSPKMARRRNDARSNEKVSVNDGRLLVETSTVDWRSDDPHRYPFFIEFQVFEHDGQPATWSYYGPGQWNTGHTLTIDGKRYHVAQTLESIEHDEGFTRALEDYPNRRGRAGHSNAWWAGYEEGFSAKKKRAKNPSRSVSIRDGFLLMQQDIQFGDHTYHLFVEYQVLDPDRTAARFSYTGPAELSGYEYSEASEMTIGDETYTIVRTEAAQEKWRGFYSAINEDGSPASHRGQSQAWLEGYREAQGQMKSRQRRRAKNPSRQRNYLDRSAPCELDATAIDPHDWSAALETRGLKVIDRRAPEDRSVVAKDVWIDGEWIGVYWYCLNWPDTEGWNWLAADGTRVEHTTRNNVQAERALVAHMKRPRQRNPRTPVLVNVRMNEYDEEILRFVFDNLDGTYDILDFEDNADKDHWTERTWTRIAASTPGEANTLTDWTAVGMPYVGPPTKERRVRKLPKWASEHRKPQSNPRSIASEFVARHADDRLWKQRLPGGTSRPPCEFDRDALAAGLEVELEHTTDPAIALEIAMDHLDEDPKYYKELAKIHREERVRNRSRNPGAPQAGSRENRLSARLRSS